MLKKLYSLKDKYRELTNKELEAKIDELSEPAKPEKKRSSKKEEKNHE